MKKLLFLLAISFCLSASAQKKVIDSKTNFAREALQPYVDRGELPGNMIVATVMSNFGFFRSLDENNGPTIHTYEDADEDQAVTLEDLFGGDNK